jgi:nucleoside-diphosphate-sugar epimerase
MVRYLLARGHEVTSYDLLPFDYPEKDQIKWIVGDIRNMDFLKESMKGSDFVIHAAAALPLYSAEDIRTTDIDGTRNVCEASLQNGSWTAVWTHQHVSNYNRFNGFDRPIIHHHSITLGMARGWSLNLNDPTFWESTTTPV